MELLLGENILLDASTVVSTEKAFKDSQVVGIYFGAHWAPPCRLFTEKLARFYHEVNKEFGHFQIVFVSDDGNKDAFARNFGKMGWLALPYEN